MKYPAPIWSPYSKLQINQVEKVQRTAACWTCRRWRNTSSVGEMLDELEWPSLEARRDRSSLLLFHKIHSGAVSIEKDKYLTPARSLKSTRSSHSAQYCRYQTYSDALKNSFFPRTIPQWNSLSPLVVNSQTAEELIVRVFSDVLMAFLYFDICHYRQSSLGIKNSEFSQPVVAGHFQ